MNRTVTDKLICSTDTPHTAERSGIGWTVTRLPGRVLTPSQTEAAMNIAEERGTIPACPQWGATAPRIAWIGWTGTSNPDVSQPAAAWKRRPAIRGGKPAHSHAERLPWHSSDERQRRLANAVGERARAALRKSVSSPC